MAEQNPYESERLLAEYLLFHYGRPEEVLPYPFGPAEALGFPARIVAECLDLTVLPLGARALDLGCAVGRTAFELARHCEDVVGIDFSLSFIQTANTLRNEGSLRYRRVDEGRLTTECIAVVPPEIPRQRVQFDAGDACWLGGGLGRFDAAFLVNLLDRLKEPRWCLEQLPGLLHKDGQLVIASPFTWSEDYTPEDKWLGGFEQGGRRVMSFDALREYLAPDFHFIRTLDVPFLIREHARKFQWSVSQAGVWRRR